MSARSGDSGGARDGGPMREPAVRTLRTGVLSLNISARAALYAAYMQFLQRGGLFVPTQKAYALGDEVFMLVQLLDDPARHAVSGEVVWITPHGAQGGRTEGVGIQFAADEAGRALRDTIEKLLAGHLGSNRPTHTL